MKLLLFLFGFISCHAMNQDFLKIQKEFQDIKAGQPSLAKKRAIQGLASAIGTLYEKRAEDIKNLRNDPSFKLAIDDTREITALQKEISNYLDTYNNLKQTIEYTEALSEISFKSTAFVKNNNRRTTAVWLYNWCGCTLV